MAVRMVSNVQMSSMPSIQGASSPLRTPDSIQQNSRSSQLIQEMQNEEGDLQQQILAQGCRSNDPEDRGYKPSTVPRGCTDALWILPFLVCAAIAAYAVGYAVQQGDLDNILSLPDLHGNLCGSGLNRGKPFLYFCMQKDSQHIMEGNQKRLDMANPICVGICPGTYNTSSRCWLPLHESYAWVQDYPTQPFIGLVCRPSMVYTKAVYDQFSDFVEQAPPVATLSIVIRAWKTLLWAGLAGLMASYFFIAALSREGANCIVLTGVLVVIGVCGTTSAYLFWCASPDAARSETCAGSGSQSNQDFAAGCGLLVIGAFFLCLACQMSAWMENAVKLIQWSCKCILYTPSLFLAPPIIVALRGLATVWGVYVAVLLVTAGMSNYKWSLNYEVVDQEFASWRGNRQFALSPNEYMCLLVTVLMNIWVQGIIYAFCEFVTVYTSQMWYFSGGMSGQGAAPVFSLFRACWVAVRYHLGSIIAGGLKIMVATPFHFTLGWIDAATKSKYNPVGNILGGCCDCCLNVYRSCFGKMTRHAFLDVSLQAMPFNEAAEHVREILAQESTAFSLLTGASWLLQIVGLGLIATVGHIVVQVAIQTDPDLNVPTSPHFVQRPELLSFAGAALALFIGFPFMTLFDIVSDCIAFCRTMQKMRMTAHQESAESHLGVQDVLDRACATRIFSEMVGCHCGGRDRSTEEERGLLSSIAWSSNPSTSVAASPTRMKDGYPRSALRIPSIGQRG
mmetsp:Transcript_38770/g.91033  ORF Transcript_38770/g.91033 Transcript_38770/m.91033 type:complete len:734 (-) Transcript_38770:142-2343(-)